MNGCHPNNSMTIPTKEAEHELYTTHERILLLGVFAVLIVIGLLGNIGVIFVIYKLNYMRNLTTFYLANLAAADMFHYCDGSAICLALFQFTCKIRCILQIFIWMYDV